MKHLPYMIGIAFLGLIFWIGAIFGENEILDRLLIPGTGITLPEWLNNFQLWTTIILASATLMSLLWYVLGAWVFTTDDWTKVNKRSIWWLLFIPTMILSIIGCLMAQPAQAYALLAYSFYFFNGLLCYYCATVFTSPMPFKYIPRGAIKFRRW